MKIKSILLSLVLLSAFVLVALRHRSVSTLRSENQTLAAVLVKLHEASKPAVDVGKVNEEELQLRTANRDLPKLRNDVFQLRKQVSELAALRSENERLRRGQASSPTVALGAPTHSTVPLEQLQFAGFATPEATLQTFHWAMKHGDYAMFLRCHEPGLAGGGASALPSNEDFQRFPAQVTQRYKAIRIVAKKIISGERIHLGVQAVIHNKEEPEESVFMLRLIEGEWKLTTTNP